MPECEASAAAAPPTARGKRMAQLGHCDCRFPIGRTSRASRFCGQPAQPGSPYCAYHHAIAYQPRIAEQADARGETGNAGQTNEARS